MLGELVAISKSVEPGSDYYLKEGIPFVRVSDLTKFGVTDPLIYLDDKIFKDVIRPKQDTILMSKDGSIGIAYKVEKDENFITSGAILHLQIIDNNILPDYLTLVINSKVVQMQAERDSGGSIIQHWKPSEINNVVIPILPMEKQLEISQLVQESFRLRSESKRLLNVAKTAVEIAISENEETALNYLKENDNDKA
jgi:restriction endonuclease S subunit